jgi:hypothetical protein
MEDALSSIFYLPKSLNAVRRASGMSTRYRAFSTPHSKQTEAGLTRVSIA